MCTPRRLGLQGGFKRKNSRRMFARGRGEGLAAGPPRAERYAPAGTWSRQRVIAALQEWTAETGRAPHAYEWEPAKGRCAGLLGPAPVRWEREHPRWPSLGTVCRYARSWTQALALAGLAPAPRDRPPLAERVASAQALGGEGCSTAMIAELLGVHRSTVSYYLRAESCPRCGQPRVRPTSTSCLSCRASNARWRRFSDAELLEALRAWTREYGAPPRAADWRRAPRSSSKLWEAQFPRWPPASVLIARFGSWREATRAAGLSPRRLRWTDEQTRAALRAWARRHGRAPRAVDWSRATDEHPSTSVPVARFGSWTAALRAAGLSARHQPYTTEQVTAGLRELERRLGRPPRARDLRAPWPTTATCASPATSPAPDTSSIVAERRDGRSPGGRPVPQGEGGRPHAAADPTIRLWQCDSDPPPSALLRTHGARHAVSGTCRRLARRTPPEARSYCPG
jgi:Homing endonuclease associated repeat